MTTRETRVWAGTGWASIAVPSGRPGKSAYELAVENGFVGTIEEWFATLVGPAGPTGPAGATGPTGPQGVGVPAGGTTGQVLTKNSSADYDFSWQTLSSISGYDPAALPGNVIVPDGMVTGGTKTVYFNPASGINYNIHTFSYNLGQTDILTVDYPFIGKLLVVAGGGGGGGAQEQGSPSAGGGGAGGLWYGDYAFGTGEHDLVVGLGGAGGNGGAWWTGGQTQGTNGTNTTFDNITMIGGGGGGTSGRDDGWGGTPGLSGGSGGGGGRNSVGGNGTAGQGRNGGGYGGAGGGYSADGAAGGAGLASSLTGSLVEYGKGGPTYSGVAGMDGTGNGGGASASQWGAVPGQRGGNGVVIVRYRIT